MWWQCSRAVLVETITNAYWLNMRSKMANLVMPERFIENMCQIAVIWEGVITKSKTIKIYCVLQLSGLTEHLEIYVTRTKWPTLVLCQNFPLKLPCSYKWFCSIRGCINLGHILYLFINFADFRYGKWLCIEKPHFPSQTTNFASFVAIFKLTGHKSTKSNIRSGSH